MSPSDKLCQQPTWLKPSAAATPSHATAASIPPDVSPLCCWLCHLVMDNFGGTISTVGLAVPVQGCPHLRGAVTVGGSRACPGLSALHCTPQCLRAAAAQPQKRVAKQGDGVCTEPCSSFLLTPGQSLGTHRQLNIFP